MKDAKPLLALERLAVAYGGIQAVKGIDVTVGDGELVCLIGANGAGKTTTLKGICGLLPIKSGRIRYAGDDITGLPSFKLVRRGLAMVPEGRGVFGALTIEENLAMGAYIRTDRDGVRSDIEHVFTLFPRLKERRRQTAGTMSGGEQQMLAMGRALMSKPRLLLLDEPTSGVAADEKFGIMDLVMAAVRGQSVTVLFVEHDMDIVARYAARVIAFYDGRVIADGEPKKVLADAEVRRYVIGEDSHAEA